MANRAPYWLRPRPSLNAGYCLLVLMAGAPPLMAQHEAHGGHGAEPLVTPGRIQVVHEPDHRDVVFLLGPIRLPATGNTMRLTPAGVVIIPEDGWLIGFRTRVLDQAGRELPSEILHHVNVVRPGRRELFLPIMQRLAAAGQETGEIRVPFPFGVPLSRGDTVLVAAMVHNPTDQAVTVTVEGRLHYDTPAWLNRVGVQPFYLDVQPPPAEAAFDLPPGRSTFTWEGSPAINVEVLGLGAHVHQFAEEIRLEEVRADREPKVLWQTRPRFRTDGRVEEIPRKTFLLRFGLGLSKDRTYRLVVVYHNPTGRTIPAGGMGELAGVVLPEGPWPEPDPTEPRYRSDYRHFARNAPELLDRNPEP